jgi:4-hydroxy-4-methyl-2-oxoglutarate aldolase
LNLGFRMFTDIPRPKPEMIEAFRSLRSCDVSDVMRGTGTMSGINPVYRPIAQVVGPAVTVSIPIGGLNMIKMGMEQTRPGDVLVVSGHGDPTCAMWGGNLSRGLKARGVRAMVIDGSARDVTEIREAEFPVFAKAIATAVGVIETTAGEVNVPIACGGAVVNPGDIVLADEDGIVVVPPEAAMEVADAAASLMAHHEKLQPVLMKGEVTRIAEITEQLLAKGFTASP